MPFVNTQSPVIRSISYNVYNLVKQLKCRKKTGKSVQERREFFYYSAHFLNEDSAITAKSEKELFNFMT